MKTYIKPTTELCGIKIKAELLSGSGSLNRANDNGNTYVGGNSQQSDGRVDTNGNVDDMAKDHNARSSWDD